MAMEEEYERAHKEIVSELRILHNIGIYCITERYEERLISEPNSSLLWIEYASELRKQGELISARKVFERALQSFHSMEEERKNVWIAYFNLECSYGTELTTNTVLERAVVQNDPLEMHMAMASILSADFYKRTQANELYERMVEKFREHTKVWMSYATWLMTTSKESEARALLTASLKNLPKKEHITMTQQFALLEYTSKHGDRGRMLFEDIIASHPKRLDVWLVYLAQEEKRPVDNMSQIRSIYERLLKQKLSTKKAKRVFKKYLDFEKSNGSVQTVKHVKKLARTFVEAKN